MTSVLIDYKLLPSNQLNIKAENVEIGLILILNEHEYKKLSAKLESQKLDFVVNYVKNNTFYIIYYSSKKNICILTPHLDYNIIHLGEILNCISKEFNPNTLLWIGFDINDPNIEEKINIVSNYNFENPYITSKNPLNVSLKCNLCLAFTKLNINEKKKSDIVNYAKYNIEQSKSDTCNLRAKFTNSAIDFLKKTSKNRHKKEISGELYVTEIKSNLIHIIDVNKKSISIGEDENVDVSPSRYNFHSHPEEAYIKHSVNKAWPSLTDYLGYLKLGNRTIFHCVATLEGLYIMSFSPYWSKNLKKVDKDFIKKNYNIDHKENFSPKEYVKKICNIMYKNYPIYIVQFLPWNEANRSFSVHYAKVDNTCISNEDDMKNYKKLNN